MAWSQMARMLDDPLAVAAFAGAGSAALCVARRLSRPRVSLALRPLAASATTSYFVGGAIALILSQSVTASPLLTLGITLLTSWVCDWPSDETRAEWRQWAVSRLKAMIRAAIGDRED